MIGVTECKGRFVFGFARKSLGIDMGSSNTTIVVLQRREVVVEPTFVAYASNRENTVTSIQYGTAAKSMFGRTPPSVRVVRPFRQGAIANFDSASDLIKHLVQEVRNSHFVPRARFDVFACVPESATNVEKRAIKQSLMSAGARRVTLLRKPIVAAIGAGVDVQRPIGSLVVDIGGGTCEISIISLTDLIASRSIRIGGERMDEEISSFLKRNYGILIGDSTAEEIKDSIGSALLDGAEDQSVSVRGRNAVSGIPTEAQVAYKDVVHAITPVIDTISDAIRNVIEQAPPDVMADVLETGILLTGGVARLHGIAPALSARLGLAVKVADDPSHVIARGLTAVLQNQRLYKHIFIDAD